MGPREFGRIGQRGEHRQSSPRTWYIAARRYLLAIIALLVLSTSLPGQVAPEELLQQANQLAEAGNWVAARPLYVQAERAFTQMGDRRQALYAKFGRLRRDVETGSYDDYLKEINADLATPEVAADPALRLRGLAVRASIHMNLSTSEAQQDWQEIARIAGEIGDARWSNRAAGQLGILAGMQGDYNTALNALLSAIRKAIEQKDTGAEIYFKTFFGNGLVANNRADQALALFDSALDAGRKSPDAGFQILPLIGKIRALQALKRDAQVQKLIAEALPFVRDQQILGAQAELLVQSGLSWINTKNYASAETALREAVEVAEKAALQRMVAMAQSGLVDLYRATGDMAAAEKAADAAVEAVYRPEEIYTLPQHLAKKAETKLAAGRVNEAERLYEEATSLIEGMLVNMPSSMAKTSMISAMSRVYAGHFRLAIEQSNSLSDAFRIVEGARGRGLADSLRYGKRRPEEPPVPAELRIAEIQRQIRQTRSSARLKELLRQLEIAETELAGVESRRNRQSIREMALLGKSAVGLAGFRAGLRRGETVLEFVLDEPNSYCLAIQRDRVAAHVIEERRKIEGAVDQMLRAIREKKEDLKAASYLYAELIAKCKAEGAETLVIVPDGKLHLLPFSALRTPDSKYLVQKTRVFSSPSATVLHVLRDSKRPQPSGPHPLLALGYSTQPEATLTATATRGAFDFSGASFRPLPFAKEEVVAAATAAGSGSLTLVGEEASEARLKAAPLSRFRVLHFAAHGVGSDVYPERSGIVMQPGNASEDGLWQPREIRRQALAAELVTLSACETAIGRLEGQEGVANLAKTFILAGAKSVVASLWMVDDRSTATLMGKFYEHVGRGKSVAVALSDAQREMIQEFGENFSPYYWAGFLVMGDGTRQISFGATKTDKGAASQRLR